jgi:hypothetical protein
VAADRSLVPTLYVDAMINNLCEQADDLRAIKGKFDDCRLGRC